MKALKKKATMVVIDNKPNIVINQPPAPKQNILALMAGFFKQIAALFI
jgi:hypothetical protein